MVWDLNFFKITSRVKRDTSFREWRLIKSKLAIEFIRFYGKKRSSRENPNWRFKTGEEGGKDLKERRRKRKTGFACKKLKLKTEKKKKKERKKGGNWGNKGVKRRTFKSLTSESLVEGRASSLDPRSLSCCWSFWLAILESNRSSAAAHLRKNWVQKWSFCSWLANFRCWLKGGERVFLFSFYFFFFNLSMEQERETKEGDGGGHTTLLTALYMYIYTHLNFILNLNLRK